MKLIKIIVTLTVSTQIRQEEKTQHEPSLVSKLLWAENRNLDGSSVSIYLAIWKELMILLNLRNSTEKMLSFILIKSIFKSGFKLHKIDSPGSEVEC